MEQTHPVEKVVTHNLTRTGVSLSFLFAFTFPVTTHFQPIPHSQLTSSPLSLGHSKCTGRSKHPTYDSIHPRVLRTKIVEMQMMVKFRCRKLYLCTIPSPLNPLCPTPIGDFNLFVPVQIILKK